MKDLPWSPYPLEIDEEGYPVSEGLRLDDEHFLKEMLEPMRRKEAGNLLSPLVSEYQGHLMRVQAFDAPLVAQNVEAVDEQSSLWIFPGDLKQKVWHRELEIDEWNRLHAWIGNHKIPAVLSRKAQAALLHRAPIEKLSPKPFRSNQETVNSQDFWEKVYQDGEDAWDQGKTSPVLAAEYPSAEKWLKGALKIAVPGAGRAHDAVFLQARHAQSVAIDFSKEAEAGFKKIYPDSKLKFEVADVFAALKQMAPWDAIFEHTFFCAIAPERRKNYIDLVRESLKSGGLFFGIFFLKTHPGGPPYGLTQWELKNYIHENFDILDWRISQASHPARMGEELWAVFRKR